VRGVWSLESVVRELDGKEKKTRREVLLLSHPSSSLRGFRLPTLSRPPPMLKPLVSYLCLYSRALPHSQRKVEKNATLSLDLHLQTNLFFVSFLRSSGEVHSRWASNLVEISLADMLRADGIALVSRLRMFG